MFLRYTDEQRQLRDELRAYFADLMTPELRASLDASWRERLAQASGLYTAWSQAVTRYKTWKLQQPKR